MKTLARGEDAEQIRGRLAALRPGDGARWGVMRVEEMVCHLRAAFAVALGEKRVEMAKVPIPRPMYKWLALWVPMQWPKGVETVPELKRGRVAAPESFERDRAGAQMGLERLIAARENQTAHAYFGRMTGADWMRWGYLHTDHHLRQFGR